MYFSWILRCVSRRKVSLGAQIGRYQDQAAHRLRYLQKAKITLDKPPVRDYTESIEDVWQRTPKDSQASQMHTGAASGGCWRSIQHPRKMGEKRTLNQKADCATDSENREGTKRGKEKIIWL